ncbi:unnamed protein product [Rangifer tarandus platyrhynchus]|uniref:Uncharacterized protein n=1 Tax=Rangifer tarandus platyrhynchus TaxID=3082113 RepID=A0ABN8ZH75_RANTA|nr:unnamed protein product [Rangifer tarandus platyrhynchus]
MGFFCLVSVSCKVPPGKPQPQPLDGTAAFTHRFSGNHYSRHPDHPHGKIPGQEDPRRAHIELGLPEKNGASENRLKSMETRGEPHLWGVRRETRDKALLPPRTQSHQPPGEQLGKGPGAECPAVPGSDVAGLAPSISDSSLQSGEALGVKLHQGRLRLRGRLGSVFRGRSGHPQPGPRALGRLPQGINHHVGVPLSCRSVLLKGPGETRPPGDPGCCEKGVWSQAETPIRKARLSGDAKLHHLGTGPPTPPPDSSPFPLWSVLTHRSPDSLGVSGSPPTPRGLHCPTWELHIPVCRPSLPQSDPGWALRPAQTRRPPLGTPSTILIGALPTVGEDRTVRAQPLTLRAKQRRLREVRSELALHNQEADSSHGSSAQITPGSVLSSRTSRHPPQQAARRGATQPCLWPAGESGAEAPF